MAYKNISNFTKIIDREDFTFISDKKNISSVADYIKNINTRLTTHDMALFITQYKNYLDLFANWINTKNLADLHEGYTLCVLELNRYIKLAKDYNRVNISRGMTRKFVKNFYLGLNFILNGLRAAFDPLNITKFQFSADQLKKYVLDKKEGLQRTHSFNTSGSHGSFNKLATFNKNEVLQVIRLIVRYPEIRQIKGWKDLGMGGTIIRILMKSYLGRKDKIYFMYNLKEKLPRNGPYRKTLTGGYDAHKGEFKAA